MNKDRRTLLLVFTINAGLFVAESVAGWLAHSMGLVADGLDMLADAIVYGLALAAIGRAAEHKRRVAHISGFLQLGLGVLGFAEVLRRALGSEAVPAPLTMALISLFALAGNLTCLYLLRKSKNGEAHMQASWIFTSTDAQVNVAVMVAAGLVAYTDTRWPDLVIGAVVFGLVLRGAWRIMRL
ncbi:MAG: cation transporter [Bacteroidetes bacterium]|nr:cation transporter [Bacteroidota bacterium]MBS1941917.1 cation transporter [Bacteroidota bacterium]